MKNDTFQIMDVLLLAEINPEECLAFEYVNLGNDAFAEWNNKHQRDKRCWSTNSE